MSFNELVKQALSSLPEISAEEIDRRYSEINDFWNTPLFSESDVEFLRELGVKA